MESPVASLDVSSDGQGAKCKSKAVLNRRPSGYWKVFSAWWRGRFQALKTRPTVHEVIEWYNKNAATSWSAGQVPSLKAVLRQSKGLRPIDGLKEYFREYRKKRKQQGGQALTANDDAPASRRARPAKRRRTRSSRDDSSDDDEMDAELSVCSDEEAEAQACSEDGEMAEVAIPECRNGSPVVASEEPSCAAAPVAADEAVAAEDGLAAAPVVLPGGWLRDATVAAEVPATSASADLAVRPLAFPGAEQVGFPQPSFAQLESPFMPLAAIPPAPLSKNAVHPAVAGCMVPLPGGGCSTSSTLSLATGPAPDFFDAVPSAPFVVLAAVPVCRGPPRLTARTRRAAAATLPPLTVAASAPLAAAGPQQQQQPAQSEEEHAADRCSAGGCMPPPSSRTLHHQGFDGAVSHCFYPPYGPPMPYNAYPHAMCTCYPPPPSYPAYRAQSTDCSSGGAASSGCCAPMPPQCFPPPHHQHQPAWGWYGPEPSCPYPCCAAPPPPCTIAGCRCSSPMPSPPHMPYSAWHGPHSAPASSEPWEAAASPVAQHGVAEHTSDVEVCSGRGPKHCEQQQHAAAMMAMMHHGRPAPFAYTHHAPCPPWARHGMPAFAPAPCGMVTVGSTNSVASLEVESGIVGAPSTEPCRLQRTSWPFAHDQQHPHAPAMPSPAPEASVTVFKCTAATAECDAALPCLDSLGAAGREGLDHELGMAWESFLNDGTDAMLDSVLVDA
ncbi:hypothetical protein HXX76_011263 [Chlamydomonas incerta]|uniref:Uncharacterized protein n=1 Tax=Chlamydomonas incerta TaxID=51695 RepID=A0A835T007_CHLIN|nr:hypothetical protein HXX76_011263 [Chlamydomonas incerta]|eukprot:KAG2429021.1 hypothetical protein HXX76_011263 [Chlamydomonas incerta]